MWQLAHCAETDTLVWNCPGVQLLVPDLWQLSQLVMATPDKDWYGMWFMGFPSAGG